MLLGSVRELTFHKVSNLLAVVRRNVEEFHTQTSAASEVSDTNAARDQAARPWQLKSKMQNVANRETLLGLNKSPAFTQVTECFRRSREDAILS